MTMTLAPDLHVLSDETLERLAARAALSEADRGGDTADFEELARAGYLLVAVPVELGGLGGNLVQVYLQHRRLAHRAPATALATTMHLSWTGAAADLRRAGDASLTWILEEAAAGEIFRLGQSRTDLPPVAPSTERTDPGLLVWTQCLFASVWVGVAERALDLAVAELRRSTSVGADRIAHHPMIQRAASEMALELEAASALVEQVADEWSAGVDHGDRWTIKPVAARHRATEGAKRVVDLALEVTGGEAISRGQELERLYRDVRLGGFLSPETALLHELVGKSVLGVLDET